jgi:hypothetical protein
MPLQTGESLFGAIALLLVGVCAMGLGFVLFVLGLFGGKNGEWFMLAWSWFVAVPVAVFVLFVGKVLAKAGAGRARRRRASDLVFSAEGISVEGGPLDGQHWRWDKMVAADSRLVTRNGPYSVKDGRRTYLQQLEIDEVVVAESMHEQEQHSFAVVLDAVWAGLAKPTAAAPVSPEARVLSCSQCGAALVPEDVDHVTCRHCRADITVDPDVRQRVRDARTLQQNRARTDRLVSTVLRQPGARRTNAAVSVTAVAAVVGAPALLWVGMAHSAWGALLVGSAVMLLLVTFTRADVASRTALRALVTGFAARAPTQAGEPSTCRRCGAPLPEPPDGGVVARCVYCRTASVLGIDLGASAERSCSELSELESVVEARRREEETRGLAAVLSAALGIVGVVVMALGS